MKKLIIIMTIIGAILSSSAYALTVNDPDIIHELGEGEVYINGAIRTDVSDIQYVGNGYLVRLNDEEQRYFTEDFEQFKEVEVFDDHDSYDPYSRAGHMDEIKWADGVYMARSNVYDNFWKSGRVFEEKGYLYILNKDFGLLDKIEFEYYVREMSYIDGIYYVGISNQAFLRANRWGSVESDVVEKVYSSKDLSDWSEESNLEHVPISNGTKNITLKDEQIYIFENNSISNRIVYEEIDNLKISGAYSDTEAMQILNLTGEYFYIINNSEKYGNIWLSKDGVYLARYEVGTTSVIYSLGDLNSKYRKGYIKKSDIDKYLKTGNVYVQLDDKILGFSQPPVMENDRTLVPMRFLFEQMGAEVTWDDATQSATATINASALGAEAKSADGRAILTAGAEPEKSVTFAIDNTTATVNGTATTMDVPARLINDQTFVPLRFLSENLGYTVDWDETTNTAIVLTK